MTAAGCALVLFGLAALALLCITGPAGPQLTALAVAAAVVIYLAAPGDHRQ
jgi:hypothetical protein